MPDDPHDLDSLLHPRGEHALWLELCRLRRLLREGERLVDQLECLAAGGHPALYRAGKEWRARARQELGT